MFKIVKYYFFFNLYRRVKKNIITIIISTIIMLFTTYIFGDLMAMAEGSGKYTLLSIKWLILLLFLAVIVLNMRKVMQALSAPFDKDSKEPILDGVKERILVKEHLLSRSDRIVKKYKGSK